MRLSKMLNEEFKDWIPDMFGGHAELLINPRKSELDELVKDQRTYGNYIKIIVLADKEIMYATKGDTLHDYIIKAEKIDKTNLAYSRGYLQKQNDEWILTELEDFENRIKQNKEEISKYNWKFISNPTKSYEYIDVSYLDKYLE